MPTNDPSLGYTIVEKQLLLALERLCVGDFTPTDLPRAERALRAILTGQTLTVSRFFSTDSMRSLDEAVQGSVFFEMPTGIPEIDYEFVLPEMPHIVADLPHNESAYLNKFVVDTVDKMLRSALPKWAKKKGEVSAFIESWYEGDPLSKCEEDARQMLGYEDTEDKNDAAEIDGGIDFEELQLVTINGENFSLREKLTMHANYLTGCARAGGVIYGDSPAYAVCSEHIFTKWPEELFKNLDTDFVAAHRQLRGPKISVNVPPLVLLVLSRANNRYQIPGTIRDLREEYSNGRENLWGC